MFVKFEKNTFQETYNNDGFLIRENRIFVPKCPMNDLLVHFCENLRHNIKVDEE